MAEDTNVPAMATVTDRRPVPRGVLPRGIATDIGLGQAKSAEPIASQVWKPLLLLFIRAEQRLDSSFGNALARSELIFAIRHHYQIGCVSYPVLLAF